MLRTKMLRSQIFKGFLLIVLLFSILSALTAVRTIKEHVLAEAQKRASLDLGSAWAVWNSRMNHIETIVRMVALKEAVVTACAQGDWSNADVHRRLERIRTTFGIDFLDIVAADGTTALRLTPPYTVGDYISSPAVTRALRGEVSSCVSVLSAQELGRESAGLAEKAFLVVEDTPQARPSQKTEESRGMVMVSAAPVISGQQVAAVVYGGMLVNRNHDLVDQIRDVIFKNETYKGMPTGTATIFLNDVRVATTVRLENGNRALGTRVSKKVADTVLDNGRAFVDEAFVVKDWYLTAYEPIRDGNNGIVGMLYVGILKKPFDDYARQTLLGYLLLSLFILMVGLVLAYVTAGRLARPIHQLVLASHRLREGAEPELVEAHPACKETEELVMAFNRMAQTLFDREQKLKTLNLSYMDMLGFVSHELRSPVSAIINYAYALVRGTLGPLTEKQARAARSIDASGKRLAEMVRHYLNLSRIETGDLNPVFTDLAIGADVVEPLLDHLAEDIAARRMVVTNNVGKECIVSADVNMIREVFENLVGNAVKYGREGGRLVMDARDKNGNVEFRVWNEGSGIPSNMLEEVFQKFVRVNSREWKLQKGTGLGLFITRQIIEKHGGSISASSVEGEWAEFKFTLPKGKNTKKEGAA